MPFGLATGTCRTVASWSCWTADPEVWRRDGPEKGVKGVGKSPRSRPHKRQEAAETEQRLRLLAIILRMIIEIVQPFLDHWSGGGPGRLLLRLAARAQKRHPRSSLTRANERGGRSPSIYPRLRPGYHVASYGEDPGFGEFPGDSGALDLPHSRNLPH